MWVLTTGAKSANTSELELVELALLLKLGKNSFQSCNSRQQYLSQLYPPLLVQETANPFRAARVHTMMNPRSRDSGISPDDRGSFTLHRR